MAMAVSATLLVHRAHLPACTTHLPFRESRRSVPIKTGYMRKFAPGVVRTTRLQTNCQQERARLPLSTSPEGAFPDSSASSNDSALEQLPDEQQVSEHFWLLPGGVCTAMLVPCKLRPPLSVELMEVIRNCAPEANDSSADSVIAYAKRALEMVAQDEKSRRYQSNFEGRALLFNYNGRAAESFSWEDLALAAGVAQLFKVCKRDYQLTNFGNAKSVVFVGDSARAHAAAYVYGAIYIAEQNARNQWRQQRSNSVVGVGDVKLYSNLAECMRHWTVTVLKGIGATDMIDVLRKIDGTFFELKYKTLSTVHDLEELCDSPPRRQWCVEKIRDRALQAALVAAVCVALLLLCQLLTQQLGIFVVKGAFLVFLLCLSLFLVCVFVYIVLT
eukprot:jgi/Chlat1/2505/Chrsp175S00138